MIHCLFSGLVKRLINRCQPTWFFLCCSLFWMASHFRSVQADMPVLALNNSWRYEQRTNLNGVSWQSPAYDDSGWPEGKAPLYVETATLTVPRNTPLTIGRITYYFRTQFSVPDLSTNFLLSFSAYVDDGAVFYLNGQEIHRLRMPPAPALIRYESLATSSPLGGDALLSDNFVLQGTALTNLVVGTNVLAVEVHQSATNSDDIVWGTTVAVKFSSSAPVLVQSPTHVKVLDGRSASFSAQFDGDPVPTLQWFKDGIPIPSATNAVYSIPSAYPIHAGTYWLAASNKFGTVTTTNVELTVLADTQPPVLLSATAQRWLTDIAVSFSEALHPSTATNPANYSVFQSLLPSNRLEVMAASLQAGSNIILRTTARIPGVHYSLRVNDLQDTAFQPNRIPPDSEVSLQYQVDLTAVNAQTSWRYFQEGMLPSTNWTSTNFDDSSWPMGAAIFSTGKGLPSVFDPVRTPLSLMAGTNPIVTYYFRTKFISPGIIDPNSLQLRSIADDGVIFYLNGHEVLSLGMPEIRPVDYATTASRAVGSASYEPVTGSGWRIPGQQLALTNHLTAEVHQHSSGFSDAAFAAKLEAILHRYYVQPRWSIPNSVLEGSANLNAQAQISILEPLPNDLALFLASSLPAELSVPSQVTIAAGATNAAFDLSVAEDNLLNGPRTVMLTAWGNDCSPGTAVLQILDNETNTLFLNLADSTSENHTIPPAEIQLAEVASKDVTVLLTSSDVSELKVPASVVIPAGATSTVFSITVVNDMLIDGPQTVTLEASVPGWSSGRGDVIIYDDEPRTIQIELPASVIEGAGTLTNAGKIQLAGTAVTNLNITLTSSMPDRVAVSSNLTLSAGKSNVLFNLDVLDNSLYEGEQSVTLTAAISGFAESHKALIVAENDTHHFAFRPIPSPQYTNTAFTLALMAMDASGQQDTNFNFYTQVTAAGMSGAIPVSPTRVGPFTNGLWTGPIQCLITDRFVRLETLGAPGTSQYFHVENAPFRVVDMQAEDLIWDESRQLIYASVPSLGGTYSNTVTAIDPWTGSLIAAVPVGPIVRPKTAVKYWSGKMALSDDSQFLYVAVNNALAVQRVNLATKTPGPVFPLGKDQLGREVSVADLVVLTGLPSSVAVARAAVAQASGVAIYDSGIQRPTTTADYTVKAVNVLESSTANSMLLGYNHQNMGFEFSRLAVAPSGVTIMDSLSGLVSGFGVDIIYKDGLVYSTLGAVVDPDAGQIRGQFQVKTISNSGSGIYVAPVPSQGRVFFLSSLGTTYDLQAHDLGTFLPLKTYSISPDSGQGRSLVQWGTNGLAFASTAGKIYLVQSSLLFPEGNPANIAVYQTTSPDPVSVGLDLSITVTVTNAGPETASDVTLLDTLPAGLKLASYQVSQGTCSNSGTSLHCSLGMISPGDTAQLTMVFRPEVGGWFTNHAYAFPNEHDPEMADNLLTAATYVGLYNADERLKEIRISARDLVFAPNTGLLYLSVAPQADGSGNGVFPLNPVTGEFGVPILAGEDPQKLILGAGANHLYVSTKANHRVRRIDLPAGIPGLEFALDPQTTDTLLQDMAALPNQPGSIVVVQTPRQQLGQVVIYDDGIPRPNTAPTSGTSDPLLTTADSLPYAFVQNNALPPFSSGIWQYQIDPRGINLVNSDTSWMSVPVLRDLAWGDGQLYTSMGEIINPFTHTISRPLATIPDYSLVTYDRASHRAFFLSKQNKSAALIQAIEPETGALLDTLTITNSFGFPASFIQWGTNGLAYCTSSNQLFILKSTIIPTGPSTDLALGGALSAFEIGVTSNFTYALSVTNSGPHDASNVVMLLKLPSTVAYLSAQSSAGLPIFSNGLVSCKIGILPSGRTAALEVIAKTDWAGVLTSTARVISDALETEFANNTVQLLVKSVFKLAPKSHRQIAIKAQDIAYNPQDDIIYVSGEQGIALIKPTTGSIEKNWPTPSQPGRLRLTKDRNLLYCTLNKNQNVGRIITATGLLEFDLPGTNSIRDLEVLPERPTSFVLSRAADFGGTIEVYHDTLLHPGALFDSSGAVELECGTTTNELYALGRSLSGGHRYRLIEIWNNGLQETVWNENIPQYLGNFKYDGGALFTSTGEILEPSTGAILGWISGPTPSSLVFPELARQRVYFLNQSNSTWLLQAYEPNTAGLLGSFPLSEVAGTPITLLRWGEDGLAFCTSGQRLVLMRTDLVPHGPEANLGITQTADSNPISIGSNAVITVTITNAGPNSVSNAIVVSRIPTNAVFSSATTSQGTWSHNERVITAYFGSLSNGAAAHLQVIMRPLTGGYFSHVAAATSDNSDHSLSNNVSTLVVHLPIHVEVNQFAILSLSTSDIAYEPNSGLIFAALTNSQSSTFNNILVSIDPATGLLGNPLSIDQQVSRLTLSEDGSQVYLLANHGTEILRADWRARKVESWVLLPTSMDDIKAVPGSPHSLVVTKKANGTLAAVYDNARPRRDTLGWCGEIEFYTSNQLIGYGTGTLPAESARLGLTSSGFQALSAKTSDLVDGEMKASGGVIYTTAGSVIDPVAMARVRSFGVDGLVAPDASIDRVAFLSGYWDTRVLRVFDTRNLMEWGSISISNVLGTADRLIRCGTDRLAFRTSSGQVFLIRSAALPSGNPAELALGCCPAHPAATIGKPVEIWLTVTNFGPDTATSLIVTNTLPPAMRLTSSDASSGMVLFSNRELQWIITSLGPNQVATNRITLLPDQAGIFSGLSVLRAQTKDTNSWNNVIQQTWSINHLPQPVALAELTVCASDLIWVPASEKMILSLPKKAAAYGNTLQFFDPQSGTMENSIPISGDPGKLAVSEEGHFLYVGLNSIASVARFDLIAGVVDLQFPINAGHLALDMAVVPGKPGSVAIVRESHLPANVRRTEGIALFQDGRQLPLTTPVYYEPSTSIAFSTNPARLYGYDGLSWESAFRRFDVGTAGITPITVTRGLIGGADRRIHFDSGLIFASSGTVIQPESLTVVTNIADISASALCKPDVASGLLSFLTEKSGHWFLRQYHHTTYDLAREIRIPGLLGQPKSLTRWVTDGLAFLTSSNQLFLLRPALAFADLAVHHTSLPTQAVAGQAIPISLTVSNGGTSFEPDAIVTNTIPSRTRVVATQASQGAVKMMNNQVIFYLGSIATNTAATLSITLLATNSLDTTFTNIATTSGAFVDGTTTNNLSTAVFLCKADTDRDGLPDDWELVHGLNPSNAADAHQDSDNDELSNLQEYLAGTDPLLSEPVRFTSLRFDTAGGVEVNVQAVIGISFTLEISSNLVHWSPMRTFVSTGSNDILQIPASSSQSHAFYRLRMEPKSKANSFYP